MEKFEKVLVRHTEQECWKIDLFSHIEGKFYYCMTDYYSHCIPFEGNEELLNTAKVPEKIVPVMYKDVKLSNIQSIINQNIALLNSSSTVSCETYEQYLKVTSILEKLGFKWCTGKSYSELDRWDVYKEKTILFPGEGQYWDSAEGRYNLFSAEYFIAVFETAFGEGSIEYDIANKKHAVHCSTKELALKVLDIAASLGYDSWRNGESFKSNCRWEIEGNDTVYYLADRTRGYFHVAKELPGHFVIEAEDFIKKYETKIQVILEETSSVINPKIGVSCKTHQEYIEVTSLLERLGHHWSSGKSYSILDLWGMYQENTMLVPSSDTYGDITKNESYTIVSSEYFLSAFYAAKVYDIKDKNAGVHCTTKELAEKVLEISTNLGFKEWASGTPLLADPQWEIYGSETIYYLSDGSRSSLEYAKSKNFIIIEAEDFIKRFETKLSSIKEYDINEPYHGVLCSSEKEAAAILKVAMEHGYSKWIDGDHYEDTTDWQECRPVYYLQRGTKSSLSFAKRNNRLVISAEEFLKKFSKVEKPKAIHCPTLREAVIVLSMLAAEGYTWAEDPNRWGINLGDTVYYAYEHGGFGNINNVDTNKFNIVKASDFIADYPNFDSNMKETNDKVYFIGDEISGPEYIQKMENLGIANPFGYKGAINNFIYFNFNGEIMCIGENSSADIAKCVLNTYTKLC